MHDIIIVGGGVAGGTLTSNLGEDLDVLMLERSRKIELKDSGIVSPRFIETYGKSLIENEIKIMEGISPAGKKFFLNSDKPFAYIINRIGFSKFLRKKARKKASVKYENTEKIEYRKDFVTVTTNKGEYKAKMIVGCDGTLSVARKFANIKPPEMYPGILVRTRKKITGDHIKVFFNKFFSPEFFSWTIPHNNEYGIITGIRPREHLEFFKKSLNLPEGRIYSYLIPLGSTTSYSERMILVGDACGQSKPITGGGIVFSLRATKHAEKTIREAFEKKRFSRSFLKKYESSWKKEMIWEIRKQVMIRKIYRKMSNRDIEIFFSGVGKHIESVREFDYDHFTDIWKKMPLFELIKFVMPRMSYIF
jgi:digeranylgeranylglycerophospholipid reductase